MNADQKIFLWPPSSTRQLQFDAKPLRNTRWKFRLVLP